MARRSIFEDENLRTLVDKYSITLENGKALSPRKISARLKSEHGISASHVTIQSYLNKENKVVQVVKKEVTTNAPTQVESVDYVESQMMDVRKVFFENEQLLSDTINMFGNNPLVVLKAVGARSINAARYGTLFGTEENRKIVELQDRYRHIFEGILKAIKTHEKDPSVLQNINSDLDTIRDEFSNV